MMDTLRRPQNHHLLSLVKDLLLLLAVEDLSAVELLAGDKAEESGEDAEKIGGMIGGRKWDVCLSSLTMIRRCHHRL